jgi:hypothetical protein
MSHHGNLIVKSEITETKVRVEDLAALHLGLARAFGEVGIGGKYLEDVFDKAVSAQCLGCGISLSGTELAQIAVANSAGATVESKLDRVRLGYCARNGCSAKFYRVDCESLPGVDVGKVLARSVELLRQPPPEHEPEPTEPVPQVPWYRQPKWIAVVAALLVAAYWGYHYAADQGFVPGVAKKPVYQIDPSKAKEAL